MSDETSDFRIEYPHDDKMYEYIEQRHMYIYPSEKAGWEQIVNHSGMVGEPCFYVWRRLRLPEDVRSFIYRVTLYLQASREKTPEQMDQMFKEAYILYARYNVENNREHCDKIG